MDKRATIRQAAIVSVLLLAFISQASVIASRKSNTWDEPAHILSGYAYAAKGMDYLSPLNHPVLGRAILAMPLSLFLDLDFNERVTPERPNEPGFFSYSLKFLYENTSSWKEILFLSRATNIILGAVLGIYIFVWSKELWGVNGGYLSLFLFALCPNILANSSLATTDMPIAAFFFISSFYLYRSATCGSTVLRALLSALFMAFAFTSKHTAFLLAPVFVISFIAAFKKETSLKTFSNYALVIILSYVFIWAIYGFRFHSTSPYYVSLEWDRFSGAATQPLFAFLRSIKFLPESYLYGVAGVLAGTSAGKPAFLMGMYSSDGWWYYFPVAFFIKTPLPVLILLAASTLYGVSDKAARVKALTALFPALLIFTAFSMQKVDIGIRHILPAYPFIFLLIGFVPSIKTGSVRAAKAVFYLCVAWSIYSASSILPNNLAYFNEIAGGPGNGYRFLVDSNLDWGQDLNGLKSYMDKKGIDKIRLAYFGFSDPKYFGIDYEYLPSYLIMNPENRISNVKLKGWFAISATMLQGVYLSNRDLYGVFRETEPVDKIGYSIFIYRF